jgi:MFS family permease
MSTAAVPSAAALGALDARRPPAQVQPARVPKMVIAASVAGNALEFYDFVTYAFFAVYIGKAFFPAATPIGSLLLSVAVFGVGFVARPLGGVLIGAFADRVGRRPAMLLTITLITIGTLGLALTPSYASIGMAAPLIVVLCRLVQGLALGGEVGPATAFLIEAAPPGQRALYSSWQLASQGIATLVAGLFGVVIFSTLAPDQVQAWGWRAPFVVGLLLLPIAIYLRRAMPETLHVSVNPSADSPADAATHPAGNVGLKALGRHKRVLTLAVLIVLAGTVSTYVGSYMTTYAITTLKFAPAIAMIATVMVGVTTLVFALVGGWLSDRYGRKPLMLWPRVITAVITVPLFLMLIAHPSVAVLLSVTGLLAALTAISGAASIVAIPELLPRGIRATGLSIAYAIGVSLFGGSTQFIITWLIQATGNPAAPAWYVAGTSVITALAMMALPETRDKELEN